MKDLILGADEVLEVLGHVYELRPIFKAEARIVELNGVTRDKAGELLCCFIEALDVARKYRASLGGLVLKQKENVKAVKGRLTLDVAPEMLVKKDLTTSRSPAGSADLREAVVHSHADYIQAVDRQAQAEAAYESIDSKVEKLRMAYFSVHKLTDARDPSPRINGGDAGEETDVERARRFVAEHTRSTGDDYGDAFGSVDIE